MVEALGDSLASRTLAFDLLRVQVERGHLVTLFDLGTVRRDRRPLPHEPDLGEIHVSTRTSLVVVQDTARGEAVVDHVG